jgi:hypothetical protein
MPVIPVNLADVQGYKDLSEGDYAGQIDKVEWRPAREQGKFPQLMVTYAVIDGDQLGEKSSEFLSLSPNAANRLKKWFARFGLENLGDLDVDDETNLLISPDLIGIRVIFQSRIDGKKPNSNEDRYRTELVSVDEDDLAEMFGDEPIAAPVEEVVAVKEAAPARSLRPARTAVAAGQPKRRDLK